MPIIPYEMKLKLKLKYKTIQNMIWNVMKKPKGWGQYANNIISNNKVVRKSSTQKAERLVSKAIYNPYTGEKLE